MFNNLEVGTTIKFYLDWIDAYTIGVIESVEGGRYKVTVNGLGVNSVYVDFEDINEVIDKNKKFVPVIEEEIIVNEEPAMEEPVMEEPVMVENKKSYFHGLFDDGGVAEMVMDNLPNELTVYVPMFDADGTPASDKEIKSRVIEVEAFMERHFGEFKVKSISGSYVDNEGNLIMQKHIQISSYPNDEEFNHYKRHLIQQISMWVKEWMQDVLMVEYEDTIYYIYPMDDMMAKGGELWIQEATKNMKKSGSVGAFTKQAKREGLTPIEFAKKVLSKPQGYTIKTRRRANFVRNTNPDKF
jgi:hypothetical protein